MKESITITRSEYDALMRDREFLKILYDNDLESWEGYIDSISIYEDEFPEETVN